MFGTSVLGERGQVVIPIEARRELGLESGDRFVVFGSKQSGMVFLMKSDMFNSIADYFFTQSAVFEELGNTMREQAEEVAEDSSEKRSPAGSKDTSGSKDSSGTKNPTGRRSPAGGNSSSDKKDTLDRKDTRNA